jgi:hypothetical protein
MQSQEMFFRLGGAAIRLIVSKERPNDARILIRHCDTRFCRPKLPLLFRNPFTTRIILLRSPEDKRS